MSTTNAETGRTIRPCDICGTSDDHPRHTRVDGRTGDDQVAHFDCCAHQGCDICKEALADMPDEARHGDQLVAYLTKDHA